MCCDVDTMLKHLDLAMSVFIIFVVNAMLLGILPKPKFWEIEIMEEF